MDKKILARLQDWSFVNIFNDTTDWFNTIEDIYSEPDLSPEKVFLFDPDRKLEHDEWYYIEFNKEQKERTINPFFYLLESSVSSNNIKSEDYSDVRSIFLALKDWENEKIFLTRIFPRYYTMSKKIIKWSSWPALESQSSSIDFNWSLDAFCDWNKLYFKSYPVIKPIFEWIEEFYRVATEEEKKEFLQKDFFEIDDYTKIKVWPRNLRRIAAVLNIINWDDIDTRKKYIDYANQYPKVWVEISNDKMKLEHNKDVSNVLSILEERVYTTPITWVDKEAASTVNIS